MYLVTAITGQVGGVVADTLLQQGKMVRGFTRNKTKAQQALGTNIELVEGEMDNLPAIEQALAGVDVVFFLMPPNFDPGEGFPESKQIMAVWQQALAASKVKRVVCLSTIGAQAAQLNLLTQLQLLEQRFSQLPQPVCFLRAGWFMENCLWDLADVRGGNYNSFLQPLDREISMVSILDVGRVAAELMLENWQGKRIVELQGPQKVSPVDIAQTFSQLLGHNVASHIVPRHSWQDLFAAQGMQHPLPRIQMLDGFNQGWIDFATEPELGQVSLQQALAKLLADNPA